MGFLIGDIIDKHLAYNRRNPQNLDLMIWDSSYSNDKALTTWLSIIEKFGFLPIKIFYSTLTSITIKRGQKVSYNFCNVCSEILEFYSNDKKFQSWLILIEKMTNLAPEALEILLVEMNFLVKKNWCKIKIYNKLPVTVWILSCNRKSSFID